MGIDACGGSRNNLLEVDVIKLGLTLLVSFLLMSCESAGTNSTIKKISGSRDAGEVVNLARMNGCLNCHRVTGSIIGPAWELVSERYKDSPDAREFLINKVKTGGNGNWNSITGGALMPAHEHRVSDEHIARIVDFILSLKRPVPTEGIAAPSSGQSPSPNPAQ